MSFVYTENNQLSRRTQFDLKQASVFATKLNVTTNLLLAREHAGPGGTFQVGPSIPVPLSPMCSSVNLTVAHNIPWGVGMQTCSCFGKFPTPDESYMYCRPINRRSSRFRGQANCIGLRLSEHRSGQAVAYAAGVPVRCWKGTGFWFPFV